MFVLKCIRANTARNFDRQQKDVWDRVITEFEYYKNTKYVESFNVFTSTIKFVKQTAIIFFQNKIDYN